MDKKTSKVIFKSLPEQSSVSSGIPSHLLRYKRQCRLVERLNAEVGETRLQLRDLQGQLTEATEDKVLAAPRCAESMHFFYIIRDYLKLKRKKIKSIVATWRYSLISLFYGLRSSNRWSAKVYSVPPGIWTSRVFLTSLMEELIVYCSLSSHVIHFSSEPTLQG